LLLHNVRTCGSDATRDRHPSTLGVLHGRIVGLDDDVRDLPATRVLDCDGAYLSAGFGDAHNHMLWFGLSLAEVDLSGCGSLSELYDTVAARAQQLPSDVWVVGSGYDHTVIGGHPERRQLDQAALGRPVWLKHRSGHQCAVSSVVLLGAGVLGKDADRVPEGGRVVRDADGQPTGVLQENAQALVSQLRGPAGLGDMVNAITRAARVYAAEGLTHVVECGIGAGLVGASPVEALAYHVAREQGLLDVRVDLMPTLDVLHPCPASAADGDGWGLDLGLRTGFGDDRLRLGPVKVWLDGSLVGRTAAVSEPFCDESRDLGHFSGDPDLMLERLVAAHRGGWRLAMHAIGDRAVDLALDVVEAAQREHFRADARHRIEHAAVVRPDQLPRMRAAGVVPVPQARFLHDMGDTMLAALGPDRVDWMYRHRSFIDAGLRVPGSSDRPVASGAPLLGMQSMVQRTTSTGRSIGPGEQVDARTALRAYTEDEAWACHDERRRGYLAPGMLADLVLLSDDPTAVAASQIGRIDVVATFLGGVATHVSHDLGGDSVERLTEQHQEAAS
jgi:predicted amidohydrolase YtcJ